MLSLILAVFVVPQSVPPSVRSLTYTCRIAQAITGSDGRTRTKPSIVARTVVQGDSARADILEGLDDFAAGDVVLTHDGGRTVYVIRAARRSYTVVKVDSLGGQMATALRSGPIRGRAERATMSLTRLGVDTLAGMAVDRARVVRSSELVIKALVITKRLPFSETIDLWLSPAHRGLPNPLGGLFLALLEAPARADSTLARKSQAVADSLAQAAPLRVVHRLESGTGKERTHTVTTIEITDLASRAPSAGAVGFQIPAGFKVSDK